MLAITLLFSAGIAVSSPGTKAQTQPWVDIDSQEAVVVWVEADQVRLSRIRFDGTRLDNGQIVSSDLSAVSPRIAFDGVNHLIVWISAGNVLGRFFNPNGDFVGDPFLIAGRIGAEGVSVAWLGSTHLVAWSGPSAAAVSIDIAGNVRAYRIFAIGQRVVGDLSIAAAGGDDALVAYNTQDRDFDLPITTTIETLLFRGGLPAAHHLIVSQMTTGPGNGGQVFVHTPRVAATADGFLLTWTHFNQPALGREVFVTRLDLSGSAIDQPFGIAWNPTAYPQAIATPVSTSITTAARGQLWQVFVDFDCRCMLTRVLATGSGYLGLSFSQTAAASIPKGGTTVVYDLTVGPATYTARLFLQFLDLPSYGRRRLVR